MVHLDEFHRELADFHFVPGQHGIERNAVHPVLPQLDIDEGQGQPSAVNGGGHLLKNIRRGADMVLVAMGEHIAAHPVFVGHQIGCVRNHQVNTQHILLGEDRAAVYHQDVIFVFKGGHVLANFVHAAQRNNPQFWCLRHNILLSG